MTGGNSLLSQEKRITVQEVVTLIKSKGNGVPLKWMSHAWPGPAWPGLVWHFSRQKKVIIQCQ